MKIIEELKAREAKIAALKDDEVRYALSADRDLHYRSMVTIEVLVEALRESGHDFDFDEIFERRALKYYPPPADHIPPLKALAIDRARV